MLIFGPGRCASHIWHDDKRLFVYNLTGNVNACNGSLNLLFPYPAQLGYGDTSMANWGEIAKDIDIRYYNYIMSDVNAFSQLMTVMVNSVDNNVFICISEVSIDPYMACINESLMKLIQTRYGFRFFIVNEPEDMQYIQSDGCGFRSVEGIQMYDYDKDSFILHNEKYRLSMGGVAYDVV